MTAMDGGKGSSTGLNFIRGEEPLSCTIFAVYPIRDPSLNQNSNGFIISPEGCPAPTLSTIDRHAIAFFEGQQFGVYKESDIAGTITTKQNRRSDMPILLEYEEYRHSNYRETDTAGTLRASGASCGPGSETLIVFVKGTRPHNKEEAQVWKYSDTENTLNTFDIGETRVNELVLKIEQAKLFIRYILRKLTPLECERLQGFPDEWTRYSYTGEEIKDTPRYVALGNSLAVPCAERVFRGIVAVMEPHSG